MTRDVQQVQKERNDIFRSGDSRYSAACANLKKGIQKANLDYGRKIEEHFNPRRAAGADGVPGGVLKASETS